MVSSLLALSLCANAWTQDSPPPEAATVVQQLRQRMASGLGDRTIGTPLREWPIQGEPSNPRLPSLTWAFGFPEGRIRVRYSDLRAISAACEDLELSNEPIDERRALGVHELQGSLGRCFEAAGFRGLGAQVFKRSNYAGDRFPTWQVWFYPTLLGYRYSYGRSSIARINAHTGRVYYFHLDYLWRAPEDATHQAVTGVVEGNIVARLKADGLNDPRPLEPVVPVIRMKPGGVLPRERYMQLGMAWEDSPEGEVAFEGRFADPADWKTDRNGDRYPSRWFLVYAHKDTGEVVSVQEWAMKPMSG
jgi:hypothetical protein